MPQRTLWVLSGLVLLIGAAMWLQSSRTVALAEPAQQPTTAPTTRPADHERSNPPLTEAQTTELLGVLKEKFPERHEELMKLKAERPTAYEWRLRMTWWWYQRWRDLPEDMQQTVIVDETEAIRSLRLARAIRETADPAEKERLTARLKESLAKRFDAQQKRNEYRVEQLKAQILRLEKELKEQAEKRDAVIADRLQRHLSGEAEAEAAEHSRGSKGSPRDETKDKQQK